MSKTKYDKPLKANIPFDKFIDLTVKGNPRSKKTK